MTPAALLAVAEADLEIALRRRELAQAIAADWPYWSTVMNGATAPVEQREAPMPATAPAPVQAASEAPQSGCLECGAPVPTRTGSSGRQKSYCSIKCRDQAKRARLAQSRKTRKDPLLKQLQEVDQRTVTGQPEQPAAVENAPFSMHGEELAYVTELLRPPPLAWEAPAG
jgi:hypothetical protein